MLDFPLFMTCDGPGYRLTRLLKDKAQSRSVNATLMLMSLFAGTFCGVFRRQALDRGAMTLNVDKIVTGTIVY